MIFATVGTHHQPFARFLAALRELDDEVIVQYGRNERPEWAARAEAFMPFKDILECMRTADAVVTHAGVGSILSASTLGQVPIVVPRLARLGEHVDDHQVELSRALGRGGRVVVVWEGDDLSAAIASVRSLASPERLRVTPLHAAVREALVTGSAGGAAVTSRARA
jgi:UDP-N-acetylglucosamine transferase subunit ALG13